MKQINLQIEIKKYWLTSRCYKIIKETISEEAFYKIRKSEVDILNVTSNIYSRLRDELYNKRYERLSNNQLS